MNKEIYFLYAVESTNVFLNLELILLRSVIYDQTVTSYKPCTKAVFCQKSFIKFSILNKQLFAVTENAANTVKAQHLTKVS